MEILSPAGSFTHLCAAVQNGADAVYCGLTEFNARQRAKNFTREELYDAIEYCHLRGVKIYLTLNTLLTDRELLKASDTVRFLNDAGIDALIVQDLGVLRMVRETAPELPIHASTQMSVHNLEGVMRAHELGASRVVISRELPMKELEYICRKSPIGIEVFLHGALCVSYSGQCYMSAAIGKRSGNRGMCAGPCRMPYTMFNEFSGYHLSMKDLSLGNHLRELSDMGVEALKIEGRLKRPEYVAAVTSVYKRAAEERRELRAEDTRVLQNIFSRGGFTDGFFTARKGASMFGLPKEPPRGETVRLYSELAKSYEKGHERKSVALHFSFYARENKRLILWCEDKDGNIHIAKSESPLEKARVRESTVAEIEKSIKKTGGTPFYVRSLEVDLPAGLSVPVSAVNALRRACIEGISQKRIARAIREKHAFKPGLHRVNRKEKPSLTVAILTMEQMSDAIERAKPAVLYIPVTEIYKNIERVHTLILSGINVCARLPRVIFSSQHLDVYDMLRAAKEIGVKEAMTGNISEVGPLTVMGFTARGDYGLNIMNSQALRELKRMGFSSATLSFEMNFAQIRDLSKTLDTEIYAYGRLPLMLTENCIVKSSTGRCACDAARLIDRTGTAFPVVPEFSHRSQILNSQKLFLADKRADYEHLGLWAFRLEFTTENSRECAEVIAEYLENPGTPPQNFTRGMYYKAVE